MLAKPLLYVPFTPGSGDLCSTAATVISAAILASVTNDLNMVPAW